MVAPSPYSSTAPPNGATRASPRVFVSTFDALTNTTPQLERYTRADLVALLTNHMERATKGGPGFGTAIYRRGATRGVDGVLVVTALVYEVDHAEPPWELLTPLDYVAYTTHSHTATDPHWRILIFLQSPIPKADYPDVWRRGQHWLVPNADEACKDASRFYYLPTCPPGSEPETRIHPGQPLDWRRLADVPEEPEPERPRRERPAEGDRPGDLFNTRADWRDVLEPHGWRFVCRRSDGVEYWRRPGKDRGWQATINHAGSDLLYVWSSKAPPFAAKKAYDKFGAYARLEHSGDLTAATRRLRHQGYGTAEPTWDIPTNGNGHHANVPPPNDQEGQAEHPPPRLGRTDVDNGRRLVARFGDSIRFNWTWDCWLHWDTTRWQRDTTGTIYRLAKEVRPQILLEAAQATDEKEQEALAKWALTSASERAIRAMVALARSEPGIPVTPPELDADPWKLTVPNGTLNLKTGELGPHRRQDLITRMAGAPYDTTAECPRFIAFLERIMNSDAALIAFLKRAIGSSLTGDTSDRALFIAWGSGGNGKTTLFDVIRHLLGEYALRTPTETLLAKRDGMVPNDVARLKGARFVYASEAEEGRRLAESFVKDLTGGDPISARFMRSEWFDFTPECKIWLATNHRPVVRGSDNAIWDRLKLIPFTVTIPPEERVPRRVLMAELTAELPGILRWAVEGCLEWQRDGLGDPPAVQQATREYRAAMDVVGAFIAECCVLRPDAQVTTKAIYTAYVAWCESNHEKPLSKNLFTARLAERDLRPTRIGARQDRGWAGIGLLATSDPTPDPDPDPDTTPDTDTPNPKNQDNADVVEPREGNPEKASGVSGVSGDVQRHYPCPGCDELIPVDGPCPRCDNRQEVPE